MSKKIQHIWSIICSRSIIDRDTNSLNLFDCLDGMNINLPPNVSREVLSSIMKKNKKVAMPIRYEIVHMFYYKDLTKDENIELKTVLIGPDNKVIDEFKNKYIFPKGKKRMRVRVIFDGIPFVGDGEYVFKTCYKSEKDKEYKDCSMELPIDVTIMESKNN